MEKGRLAVSECAYTGRIDRRLCTFEIRSPDRDRMQLRIESISLISSKQDETASSKYVIGYHNLHQVMAKHVRI